MTTDPTAAPETCWNCRSFYRPNNVSLPPECHRFPTFVRRNGGDRCDEWQPKPALADRAPIPSPVAVSETPVSEHEDHQELNIGPPPPGVKTYWPGEEADPYGPAIPHDGDPVEQLADSAMGDLLDVLAELVPLTPDPVGEENYAEAFAREFLPNLAKLGLRLVRDLSEEEREVLASRLGRESVLSTPWGSRQSVARAAIDAVLGPVK